MKIEELPFCRLFYSTDQLNNSCKSNINFDVKTCFCSPFLFLSDQRRTSQMFSKSLQLKWSTPEDNSLLYCNWKGESCLHHNLHIPSGTPLLWAHPFPAERNSSGFWLFFSLSKLKKASAGLGKISKECTGSNTLKFDFSWYFVGNNPLTWTHDYSLGIATSIYCTACQF